MSTTRDQLIELASPFGPFSDQGYRDRLRDAVLAGEPADAARKLLDAWGEGGDLPTEVRIDFNCATAELLADLAADPLALREIVRALSHPRRRGVALFAMALGVDPSAGQAIVAFAEADAVPPLTEDELVSLASALRTTTGDAARAAVARLLERGVPEAARPDLELALAELTPR